jgi:hypothetical protein
MQKTKAIKVVPGQVEFTPEYAGLVFIELGYVKTKMDETRKTEELPYGESNFYLSITPKGVEHFEEMKPYIDPLYYSALKILGLIPKEA